MRKNHKISISPQIKIQTVISYNTAAVLNSLTQRILEPCDKKVNINTNVIIIAWCIRHLIL